MSSAPGGVVYSSDTMFVGDATWDAARNSYLLPNLQGLNFDTMRYNGMGNRFKSNARYHSLIIAHGVIAALVFLLIMPIAVFVAKFYHANGRRALHIHVALQLLSTILLTVVVVLGVLAVGSERAFTNPHHGIGIAIYVSVLSQAIGGAIIRQTEKRKRRPYQLPIRLMLHKWFGRAIVLLGITQVALGLTLYGSPLWLFVMYAVIVAVWLILLFYFCQVMQYTDPHPPESRAKRLSRQEARYRVPIGAPRDRPPRGMLTYRDDRPDSRERRLIGPASGHGHHHWRDAVLGAGAAGAYHNWRSRPVEGPARRYYTSQHQQQLQQQQRQQQQQQHQAQQQQQHQAQQQQQHQAQHQQSRNTTDENATSAHSYQSSYDEKSPIANTDQLRRDGALGTGAPAGLFMGGRSLLRQDRRDPVRYSLEKPPLTPSHGQAYGQGPDHPPYRPHSPHVTFLTPTHSSRDSGSTMQPIDRLYRDQFIAAQRLDDEDDSSVDNPRHGLFGTLAAMTGIAAIRQRLRDRQERREEDRLDEMTRIDQYNGERLQQSYNRHSRRQQGDEDQDDGRPWESDDGRADSPQIRSRNAVTEQSASLQNHTFGLSPPPAGPRPDGPSVPTVVPPPGDPTLTQPTPQSPHAADRPSAVNTNFGDDSSMQASPIMLPAPPAVARQVDNHTTTDPATSDAGALPPPHMSSALPARLADSMAVTPELAPAGPPSYSQSQANDAEGSIYSGSISMSSVRMTEPPVSVKVRIHNNERHVTMRRLNEAEIAAERARQVGQQRRSHSSNAGVEVAEVSRGSRRGQAGAREAVLSDGGGATPTRYDNAEGNRSNQYLSPARNADGYSTPGTGTGTSESSTFEQNRRRRRAERTSPQTLTGTTAPRGP